MEQKILIVTTFFTLLNINAKTFTPTEHLKNSISNHELKITLENEAFQSIKIGNQVWMKQNLNVSNYNNGDYIREAKNKDEWMQIRKDKIPAYCSYEFNSKNDLKYGKLYNWYAIHNLRDIAPKGWHIPNNVEWETLINYLGGSEIAGLKLKTKSGWNNKGNGNDLSGFTALPAGCIGSSDLFYNIGNNGFWWSTTNQSNDYRYILASYVMLGNQDTKVSFNTAEPSQGFSIRCIKN